MRKVKIGLQKEVSRIFTGIQIPKKDASQHPHPAVVPSPPVSAPALTVAPPAAPPVSLPVIQSPAAPPLTSHLVTPAPAPPVTSHLVTPAPAAPPAHRPLTPKPLTPTPKPFTIPEPPQQSVAASPKNVYEKPAPIPSVYQPPSPSQKVYEPPQNSSNNSVIIKSPLVHKQPWQFPFLKTLQGLQVKLFPAKPGVHTNKQKAIILALPVLAIVFIIVLTNVLKKPAVLPGPAPSNKSSVAGGTAAFDSRITWEIPATLPEKLRDPTSYGNLGPPDKPDLGKPHVKGIVYSEDNPCAVVGDRIVSVGETVQGATVVKINPDSVEFSKGDQKWTQEVER